MLPPLNSHNWWTEEGHLEGRHILEGTDGGRVGVEIGKGIGFVNGYRIGSKKGKGMEEEGEEKCGAEHKTK